MCFGLTRIWSNLILRSRFGNTLPLSNIWNDASEWSKGSIRHNLLFHVLGSGRAIKLGAGSVRDQRWRRQSRILYCKLDLNLDNQLNSVPAHLSSSTKSRGTQYGYLQGLIFYFSNDSWTWTFSAFNFITASLCRRSCNGFTFRQSRSHDLHFFQSVIQVKIYSPSTVLNSWSIFFIPDL